MHLSNMCFITIGNAHPTSSVFLCCLAKFTGWYSASTSTKNPPASLDNNCLLPTTSTHSFTLPSMPSVDALLWNFAENTMCTIIIGWKWNELSNEWIRAFQAVDYKRIIENKFFPHNPLFFTPLEIYISYFRIINF